MLVRFGAGGICGSDLHYYHEGRVGDFAVREPMVLGHEVAGEVADKSVLDAALINAAQAAEHYEIARYGSLIAWSKQLGRDDAAALLQKTLEEEKATDKKLTTLAESRVNLRAAS